MKKYLLNSIIEKNRAQEAILTYSQFETMHVSKFLWPKSIVLFISKILQLGWLQNTIDIILVPQNHLDKISFTVPEEVIIKLLFFQIKFTNKIKIQFQIYICSSLCHE